MIKIPILFPETKEDDKQLPSYKMQILLYLIYKKKYEAADIFAASITKSKTFPHTAMFAAMIEKGYMICKPIITTSKDIAITKKASDLLKSAEKTKIAQTKIEINVEISEWIEEYREIFTAKPGKKGLKGECIRKMTVFFEEHPEFADKDLVMKAAKLYITNLKGEYTYMRQADYFIKKKDTENDRITSDLWVFCEMIISANIPHQGSPNVIHSNSSGRQILE